MGDWLFLIFAGSLVISGIAYPPYAEARGWPIGEFAAKDIWYGYHGFAGIGVFVGAWVLNGLLGILVVVSLSWVCAFVVVHTLRSWCQVVSLLSLPSIVFMHTFTHW